MMRDAFNYLPRRHQGFVSSLGETVIFCTAFCTTETATLMDAILRRIRPEADTTTAGAVRLRKRGKSTQSPEGGTIHARHCVALPGLLGLRGHNPVAHATGSHSVGLRPGLHLSQIPDTRLSSITSLGKAVIFCTTETATLMDAILRGIRPEADTTTAGAVRLRKPGETIQSPEGDTIHARHCVALPGLLRLRGHNPVAHATGSHSVGLRPGLHVSWNPDTRLPSMTSLSE